MTITLIPRSASQGHRREDLQLERDLRDLSTAIGCSQSELVRQGLRSFIDKTLRENDGIRDRFKSMRSSSLRVVQNERR